MSEQPEAQPDLTSLPPMETETGSAPPRQGRGCWPYVLGGMGCLIFVVVIIGALIFFTGSTLTSVLGSVGGLVGLDQINQPAVVTVVPSQTIVQGIQPLGQLVSVSVQMAKAGVFVGVGQGMLNACGFSANHAVQGAVEAGIDVMQITEEDVRYDDARDVYILTIPSPQLTSCRVDMIDQYDESFSTCNPDWDGVRQLAQYQALVDFRDDAIEGGILNRAEAETRFVLANFVRSLTGRTVEVVFETPETPIYPPSCNPEIPAGWRFDPTNGHWTK